MVCLKETWLGEMKKALSRRRICHLPLFVFFWKKNFFDLKCLNVIWIAMLADFKSDGRLLVEVF